MKEPGFALAASSFLTLTIIPSISNAGYFYEALNTNEAPGLPGAQVSTVYAWVDGDNAKIEFQDAAQAGLFQPGSYLVTTDAGDTLYLINPEKMTITEIDFDQILGMASSMMDAMVSVVSMEFSDPVNEKLSEGPGTIFSATTRRCLIIKRAIRCRSRLWVLTEIVESKRITRSGARMTLTPVDCASGCVPTAFAPVTIISMN